MQRKFKFSEGEYYHIYNRGNSKQVIFKDDRDYKRFLLLMFASNSENKLTIKYAFKKYIQGRSLDVLFDEDEREEMIVDIGAYCLMPNHFHLLLREKKEGGISSYMSKLATGYSMYFNRKYERSGALFEGRFRAEYVDSDEYLKYLFAYIHLNPVSLTEPHWKDEGIRNVELVKGNLDLYQYSSYFDYIGFDRPEKNLLQKESFPEYFSEYTDFQKHIDEWLEYQNNTL